MGQSADRADPGLLRRNVRRSSHALSAAAGASGAAQQVMRSWCPQAIAEGGGRLTEAQARGCLRQTWNAWLTCDLRRNGHDPNRLGQDANRAREAQCRRPNNRSSRLAICERHRVAQTLLPFRPSGGSETLDPTFPFHSIVSSDPVSNPPDGASALQVARSSRHHWPRDVQDSPERHSSGQRRASLRQRRTV